MKTTPDSLRKVLNHSIWDGVFYSFMVGIGETYLAAFALALGLSQILAGLVTIIPILFGSVLQLFSGFGLRHVASRRQWVSYCAFTQSFCLFLLAGVAFLKMDSPTLLFIIASFYWAAGMSAGPAWNAWMGDVIPERFRINFFAFRSRLTQVAIFIGLVIGGLTLHIYTGENSRLWVFSILFCIAGCSRLVSALFLLSHPYVIKKQTHIVFQISSPKIMYVGKTILFLYLFFLFTQITVQIAAPFYTPYMLKQLHLNYAQYMILIGSAFMGRILAYSVLSSLAKRYGTILLIGIGAFGIVPIPFFWSYFNSIEALIILQLIAGALWACHELGVFLLLLETYPADIRSKVLTWVNFINAIGMVIGSLIGAHMLQSRLLTIDTYHHIFWISAALRVLPLFCIPFFVRRHFLKKPIYTRTLGVRPSMGVMDRPILLPDKTKKRDLK
jgi:MFS family permease